MTEQEKAALRDHLFQQLQMLRWAVEQIGSTDKPALIHSRVGAAQKMLKRFTDDFRRLCDMNNQDDIAKSINNYNGQIGSKGTGE